MGINMKGVRLDHATITTFDTEQSIEFYRTYLGLEPGFRPDFGFPGAWLYAPDGDYPILHLMELTDGEDRGGNLDHIAFRGEDVVSYLAFLDDNGVDYTCADVVETPYCQIHHYDPNGVKIEITFAENLPASHA